MKIKKAMKKIKFILGLVITASLVSCVNSDDYGIPEDNCIDITANVDVLDVSALANSTHQQNDFTLDVEDYLEAIVTSSDEGGNFYKSISLMTVDGTKGFTMPINAYNLYTKYEPGRKVFINIDSLHFHYNSQISSLEIGGLYNNDTPDNLTDDKVGRISSVTYQNYIKRSCTKVNEDDIVKHLTIAQAKDNQYLNMLIEFDAVQFTDASLNKTYFDATLNSFGGATNHLITDIGGNTIILRASEYATFATNTIPNGSGKIRGVLTKYNSDYQFMIRTINDVQLNDSRLEAFFIEDFQTATNNTNLNNPGWTNFAENGTWLWREKTFSGNGYAEFSAFGSGSALNTAWLVSTAINLDSTTNELLSFKIAQHHLDVDSPNNSLEVLVSTDFDGTNVLTATWVSVPATIPTMSTSWYQFLGSSIDISGYNGNIFVAFKFTGSGTNTTLDGAFQVDDVKVFGN